MNFQKKKLGGKFAPAPPGINRVKAELRVAEVDPRFEIYRDAVAVSKEINT